ncbi:aminopeptidase [Geoalkalibacter sp.]|uniref:aminopeptidase n=1 Tax=Geoalkalibacter sp. TaxID=3041440 RepID=UPI00272E08E7|nr:aminopeptidase [Geoalkalibacter sp.]
MKYARSLFLLVLAVVLGGCGDVGYYAQCVSGHVQLMSRTRPIPTLVADPDTPPDLRRRLELVTEIRDYASQVLLLPDNASYRSYADLERPYVVWNVVATPEFALEPITWCFPVAGCVPYRGYFKEESAKAFAERLSAAGHDVFVHGVPAYSTLKWFDDPVLNTFCNREETYLAALIFHELAHQQLYIKNDSSFNEAFAKTVELVGVERWLQTQGQGPRMEAYLAGLAREEQFIGLLLKVRGRLGEIYAQPLSEELKREKKHEVLRAFQTDYAALKESWGGFSGYDHWLKRSLNNAHFASISTYHTLVPAFRTLLARQNGDLSGFYAEARALALLPRDQRQQALAQLLRDAEQLALVAEDTAGNF